MQSTITCTCGGGKLLRRRSHECGATNQISEEEKSQERTPCSIVNRISLPGISVCLFMALAHNSGPSSVYYTSYKFVCLPPLTCWQELSSWDGKVLVGQANPSFMSLVRSRHFGQA